jgi:flagellar biosynthetic protein FlhB
MANHAGERTEKPTARKIKDARERGEVARSRDLSSAVSLAGVAIALAWGGMRMMSGMTARLESGLSTFGDRALATIDGNGLVNVLWADASLLVSIVGPVALVAAVLSIAASVAQVGWAYSPKAVHMNWGRLNPASGFARLGPKQAAPELGKALIGLAAIGGVAYLVIGQFTDRAVSVMSLSPAAAGREGWDVSWTLLWRTSLALVVVAGADYGLQYWRWYSQLKMTRKEVADEAKQNEGNPQMKGRVRRIQQQMTRQRMLKAVKTATVVITNPTHFAVALKYDRASMAAPIVVAKGQDLLAARIRTIAREAEVPIVENVALARALFKGAEVGDSIPAALFGAVAEVLAYLVRMKQLVLA